jgi:hypothetical protein
LGIGTREEIIMRTVDDVIEDLREEAAFFARCGLIPTANVIHEAIGYLKQIKKEEEDAGTV